MARLLFALVLGAALMLQTATLPAMQVIAITPNLVLVLLLAWSALRGVGEGLLWAFGAGMLLDVLALDGLGANALALLPVVLLAGIARRRVFHSNLIVPIALTLAATTINAVLLLLFRGDSGVLPLADVVRVVFLQGLLNVMLVPPLYLVAGWMDRGMEPSYG